MFRMANEQEEQILEAQIHVVLIRSEVTKEGESIRCFYDLQLVRDRNALFAFLVGRLFIPSTGIARSSTRRTIAETATGTGRGVIDWSGRSSATENTRTARLPSGRDPLRQAFRGYPQAHDGTMWMVDSLQFDAVVEDHLPRTAQKSAGADVAKLAQNHPTELE